MKYETELSFLCDTLEKFRIETKRVPLNSVDAPLPGQGKDTAPCTLYKMQDSLGFCYLYFLLPDSGTLFLIGPYRKDSKSTEELLKIAELNHIPPAGERTFEERYRSLPLLQEEDRIFVFINSLCERVFECQSFAIVDLGEQGQVASPIHRAMQNDGFDNLLSDMRAMERRYEFENEMIRAVSQGQHKEGLLLSAFSGQMFERRLPDLLRNSQNYCIIMNTLLRKAAEQGGVHPIYIDRVSSEHAAKIERVTSVLDVTNLMREMFSSYCRLVRKHTMQGNSPVVRKTRLLIDSDLSADLSPSTLAAAQNVSLGYLSAVFKKEQGITLTEYVRKKRLRYAAHLLTTTQLQVQTVALHCGIMDLQYFVKLFKKEFGKTPKEYRNSVKETENKS